MLLGMALAIFAVTVWLYWPSTHGEFLRGDDREYLEQAVRWNGLTWNAVQWAFTTTQPYYHPLPRLSHVLDYQIWGKNAAGHHATNVILHALNAALVFGFLWSLLGVISLTTGERLAMAVGVAVVFAIHPLQAESVAWISGRTQLLCTTFMIGSIWVYVTGARRWAVYGLFAAALLCKPMAVSLPFVMLAIDYFPLRRLERLGWIRLLREKVVLIGLGVATAGAAMLTESQKGGLAIPWEMIPLPQRALLMFQSLMFYPWKLVWPEHLSPYYPLRLGLSLDQWPVLAAVLGVGMITMIVVRTWRRLPALAVGWTIYAMLLLPVSGLVPAGLQSVALRYAYLAILPLLLLAGGAVVWAWRHSRTSAHVALVGFLGCVLCFLGLRTRSLIPVWRDDETWWRVPAVDFPDSELANRLLAGALLAQGRANEALEFAERDVEIAPQSSKARYTLAVVLEHTGKIEEAIEQYEQTLRLQPDFVEARESLGNNLIRSGRVNEAVGQYEETLRFKPDSAEAHNYLGLALERIGRIPEAVGHFEQALRIKPDYPEALNNLAWLLAARLSTESNNAVRAVALAEGACKLSDDRVANYLDTLAAAYAAAGRFDDAVSTAQKALRLANAAGQTQLVSRIEMRLELYLAKRPYYAP